MVPALETAAMHPVKRTVRATAATLPVTMTAPATAATLPVRAAAVMGTAMAGVVVKTTSHLRCII
jgi:hypothetical protein